MGSRAHHRLSKMLPRWWQAAPADHWPFLWTDLLTEGYLPRAPWPPPCLPAALGLSRLANHIGKSTRMTGLAGMNSHRTCSVSLGWGQ